jgi:SAM-dependent methyltransferase
MSGSKHAFPAIDAKYPPEAYRGFRARLPDLLIGLPASRYLDQATLLLRLRPGDCVCDVACGSGFNLERLVRAVGPEGLVVAVEDNAQLLRRVQEKVERAGWPNVRMLVSLDPSRFERAPVDGIIVGYNPPIFLQRADLVLAAWQLLKPGGRLTAVGARCTTRLGRLAGPLVRTGLRVLGHPGDWHYWLEHESWKALQELGPTDLRVEPRLGFEYILWAEKAG